MGINFLAIAVVLSFLFHPLHAMMNDDEGYSTDSSNASTANHESEAPEGLRDLATEGDLDAQFELAEWISGKPDQNISDAEIIEAIELYKTAADRGHTGACYCYADSCFEDGFVVGEGVPTAIRYWETAAEQDHFPACYNLYLVYKGSEERTAAFADPKKSIVFLKKAAKGGLSKAIARLEQEGKNGADIGD